MKFVFKEENMVKKLSVIFIVGLATMLLLISCSRSASQSPQVVLATPTGKVNVTVQAPTGVGQIELIGTTQMLQTMTAFYVQTQAAQTLNPTVIHPTSTPFGTPPPIVLPTGGASTLPAGTTPIIVVPTSTPGHPSTYTLMTGEFPYCIARRFNVNQQELLSMNGLNDATLLQPGSNLNIPQTGNPFVGTRALHPHPTVFTVSSVNETIYSVACYFGDVDPSQIIAANNLTSPYILHMNQTLNIP
jgi:LysM repeat protein